MFDFSQTFRGVNTDFFLNFSDILLISLTSDPSDFLLNRAVRAVRIFLVFPAFQFRNHKEKSRDFSLFKFSLYLSSFYFSKHGCNFSKNYWSGRENYSRPMRSVRYYMKYGIVLSIADETESRWFFSDRHILIKRSLNMILSQNKHSVALKLEIYVTIAHIFNKYKQNTDKAIANVVLKWYHIPFFLKITAARHGQK